MDLKSTLENLKDKATDLAQAGVAQSKRLAEIAKLKTANMAEEDAIKKAYLELGKLYYAESGAAPEGAYAAACERITASKALIETNNERIAELKQSAGSEAEDELEDAVEEIEESEADEEIEEAEVVEEAAEEAPAAEDAEEEDKQD